MKYRILLLLCLIPWTVEAHDPQFPLDDCGCITGESIAAYVWSGPLSEPDTALILMRNRAACVEACSSVARVDMVRNMIDSAKAEWDKPRVWATDTFLIAPNWYGITPATPAESCLVVDTFWVLLYSHRASSGYVVDTGGIWNKNQWVPFRIDSSYTEGKCDE